MNSPRPSVPTQPATLRDRIAEWKELLERCGHKPTRKCVHALRVVTLRILAELEHELVGLPDASHQAQAMLRFQRLAEKLRQALGPVREVDVWIGKLQRLRGSLGAAAGYVPRSTRDCIRQIERLEERLGRKRRILGQKLVAEIERRSKGLLAVGDDIHENAGDRRHDVDTNAAAIILSHFGAIAAEFSSFDDENLHDFRKRIKKVRYLADISATADPACGRIAAQIRKLQSAIGEWHDWQILARTARQERRKDLEVVELLDSLAAEALETAVAMCHSITSRLLEQGAPTSTDRSNTIARKPPAQTDHAAAISFKKLA